jgi:hypothetical protein
VPQGRKVTESLFKEILKNKIEQVEVDVVDLQGAFVPPTSSTWRPARF